MPELLERLSAAPAPDAPITDWASSSYTLGVYTRYRQVYTTFFAVIARGSDDATLEARAALEDARVAVREAEQALDGQPRVFDYTSIVPFTTSWSTGQAWYAPVRAERITLG